MKEADLNYLKNEMSFDVNWLIKELNSQAFSADKQKIESFISELISVVRNKSPTKNIIQIFQRAGSEAIAFDSLRHAFTTFAKGGLLHLYEYQENESWYPKIVLNCELKPNDIATLERSMCIYRGCGKSEFVKNIYGQSWSASMEVAEKFAYEHYKDFDWYKRKDRCVLQATIESADIYFSNQNKSEKEVAVNIEKLKNVVVKSP